MFVLIDIKTNDVLARGNNNYNPLPGQKVIEIDPSEWPKIKFLGENLDIDKKQNVKYNPGSNKLEIKPENEQSIIEGLAFYGLKKIEQISNKKRNDGIAVVQSKLNGNTLNNLKSLENEITKVINGL